MLDTASLRVQLSQQERAYASAFFVAMGRHLKDSVLKELPANYQSLVGVEADVWLYDEAECDAT